LVFPRRSIHRSNSKASCSTRTKSRRGANGTTGILFGCGTCQCMTMQTEKKDNAHKTNTTGVKRWFSIFLVHKNNQQSFPTKIQPSTQTLHVDVHHQCHGGGSKTLGKGRGGG
jgi:hypothetical protein